MPPTEFDTKEDEEEAKELEKLLSVPTDFDVEEIDPDSLDAGDEKPDEEDNNDLEDENNPPDDLADDAHLVEESSELPNNN